MVNVDRKHQLTKEINFLEEALEAYLKAHLEDDEEFDEETYEDMKSTLLDLYRDHFSLLWNDQ